MPGAPLSLLERGEISLALTEDRSISGGDRAKNQASLNDDHARGRSQREGVTAIAQHWPIEPPSGPVIVFGRLGSRLEQFQ